MMKRSSVANETVPEPSKPDFDLILMLLILACFGLIAVGAFLGYIFSPDKIKAESAPVAVASATVHSSATASSSASSIKHVQYPDVSHTSGLNSEGVARLAVESLSTWDTASDEGEHSAVERTSVIFDDSLKSRSVAYADKTQWPEEAVEKQAFSAVRSSDYDIYSNYQAPVVKDKAGRSTETFQFMVNWDWVPADGSTPIASTVGRLYTVTVVKTDTGWKVFDYSWRLEGISDK